MFEVNIEKGMKNGQRIVLRGEAGVGNDPSQEPGNVVFQLDQKEHDSFKRVGHDLFLTHQVPPFSAPSGPRRRYQAAPKWSTTEHQPYGQV